MWVSWRPKRSVALVESKDGLTWTAPEIVLPPLGIAWADDINRPTVLGAATATTCGSRARPRESVPPYVVLGRRAVRTERHRFRHQSRWTGVDQARAQPGLHRRPLDPLGAEQGRWLPGGTARGLVPDVLHRFPGHRPRPDRHRPFRDGITAWQRHPANPIVRSGTGKWDDDACYKPYAIFDGRQWLLWYNGRHRPWSRSAWSFTRARTWVSPDEVGHKKCLSGPRDAHDLRPRIRSSASEVW